jgi:hypothetical protein
LKKMEENDARAISDAFMHEVNGLLTDIQRKSSLIKQGSQTESFYEGSSSKHSSHISGRTGQAAAVDDITPHHHYEEHDEHVDGYSQEIEALKALVVWFSVSSSCLLK